MINDWDGYRVFSDAGTNKNYVSKCDSSKIHIPFEIQGWHFQWSEKIYLSALSITISYLDDNFDDTTQTIVYLPQDEPGPLITDGGYILDDNEQVKQLTYRFGTGDDYLVSVSKDEFSMVYYFNNPDKIGRQEGKIKIKLIGNDDTLLSYDNIIIEISDTLVDYVCGLCGDASATLVE